MTQIESIRIFLGWSTAINLAILITSSIFLVILRGTISRIHSRMFGLNESDLAQAYFHYLAHYKIAIIVFNLVPYIALRIMA